MTCERPDAGALELLQEGELSADHWDWECGAGFRFARDEDVQEESAAKAPPQRCVSLVLHSMVHGVGGLYWPAIVAQQACIEWARNNTRCKMVAPLLKFRES